MPFRPEEEARRLSALRAYHVLDTPPDPALDDLVNLAASICDAPIALISFVDARRPWFTSRVGWDLPDTLRDLSLCVHAFDQPDLLVVPDTTVDERFAAHQLVTGPPRIRFYAGVTLRTPEGEALGTLCVMDRIPRQLTPVQEQALRVLARQVMAQLELGRRRQDALEDVHLRQLNRVHAVLSDINQTIVREKDAQQMLAAACRIAIEKGGFRMAWIGLFDDTHARVEVRAHAGADAATLQVLDDVIRAEPPGGCTFTHRALFTGEHGVCDDIARDPRTEPWRAAALERGYLSMAAFPLTRDEQVIGTFNIYAGETGFFDAEELRLLVGLAADISFALELHAREEERRLAEEHRHIAEERFREMQEQFLQAQKMESVGRLAGGIAHDFNNLLTVINGTTDLVMARLDPRDPLYHELDEIRMAGNRASALTGQLLALSRRQILQPEVLNLSEVIGDMRGMLRRLIGEDIQLAFTLADPLPRVKVDRGQIEQVILNLAVNARDAMPDGGTLLIETREVQLEPAQPGAPAAHVLLAVSDTGHGMDEATRQRIFEPFFTTKGQGKGTGLGLSTVYGIVEQSQGTIWVYSEPGQGTTFKIYLPCIEEEPGRKASRSQAQTHGDETILLVEDERGVRQLTKRILETAGYTVLAASSGDEALALLERYEGPIHLLLTDVVMPGMNGRELAARVASLRPSIRVLYTSGYTDDAILRHGVLDDSSRFISKPYTQQELTRRVRDVLDA